MKFVSSTTLALLLALAGSAHAEDLNRANNTREFMGNLFKGGEQYSNFFRMETLFPSELVRKSTSPVAWPSGKTIALPDEYNYGGARRLTADLLRETDTSALLVIKNGKIRYEQYWLTGARSVTGLRCPWRRALFLPSMVLRLPKAPSTVSKTQRRNICRR
ncbi:hypothetical protein J3P93_12665 [Pseudomonas sp. R3-57]|uniref:hypothetical protein n=1 Tax=Pseudomonas sp. R3-57 TaxID=2817402 RepID=UPI003DA9BC17